MDGEIIVLNDETGADVRFWLLDVVPYEGEDYAVLLPADEEADSFLILLAEPDPADPEDYLFSGIDSAETVEAVYAAFKARHPEDFPE